MRHSPPPPRRGYSRKESAEKKRKEYFRKERRFENLILIDGNRKRNIALADISPANVTPKQGKN